METIISQIMSAIGAGIGSIFTIGFAVGSYKLKSYWDKKQFNKSLNEAVTDAIAAVEESSRSDPGLRGDLKFQKAMEYSIAVLEANNIVGVKPILLEAKIKSALQKTRKVE